MHLTHYPLSRGEGEMHLTPSPPLPRRGGNAPHPLAPSPEERGKCNRTRPFIWVGVVYGHCVDEVDSRCGSLRRRFWFLVFGLLAQGLFG